MLHVLRKCLVIRECTNKKKLFVLVANMKCQCTAMAHRADPQAHRGGGGTMTILQGGRGGPASRAPYMWQTAFEPHMFRPSSPPVEFEARRVS